jgi:hypothetical protein
MANVACHIVINRRSEHVFDLIHDYERRLDWDPFLRRAEVIGDVNVVGKGVSTLCVARWLSGGMGMETIYVSFERPAVAAVKMTRGPWFLTAFAASIRQESEGVGVTRVTYKFRIKGRPKWFARIFDPVLNWVFRRETTRRLRALKHYMERTD